MFLFEAILVMLAGAVALLACARWSGVPYPVLLAIAGASVALLPIDYRLAIDPQLVLALFVAPILLDAAFDTSVRDLKRHWRPVLSLALFAVGLTTLAVAVVARQLVADLPWAAAIAIGAIVAPPDAVTATSILKEVALPLRLKTILEGEALLNDASTLLIYSLAVGAMGAGGNISAEVIAPAFALSIVGSIVAGPLLAILVGRLVVQIDDAPSSIILQFVSTFGVWITAERLHLSPILTVVSYAMVLAHSGSSYQKPALRVPSFAVWDTAVLVLNVLAFLLIGLELRPVILSAPPGALSRWTLLGGAVLVTVIAIRLAWTIGDALRTRWQIRDRRPRTSADDLPDWRSGTAVGWAGSRGIVTVATALALPADLPQRGMFLFVALSVTLGTLLIQGLTLKPLVLALKLKPDSVVDDEIRIARLQTADAALEVLAGETSEAAQSVRDQFQQMRDAADMPHDGKGRSATEEQKLRAKAMHARGRRLYALRRDGVIGDDAFHQLEAKFDLERLAEPNA